jgi:hypothetical protein
MGNAPVSKTLNLSRDRYFIPFQKKPYIQEQGLFFTLRPFGFAYHLPGFCDTIKYHIGSVDFFNGNFQGYFVESLCREGKLYSGNHEDHFTTPLNDSTILLSTEYSATLFRFSMKLGIITDSSGALPSYFRAKPLQNISPLTKGHELPNNDTSQPRYTEMHRFSPKSFIRSAKFPARLAKRDPLLQKGWNHLIYNEGLNVKATLPFPDNTWGTSITNFKNHYFFRKKDSPDGIIELKMMRLAEGS